MATATDERTNDFVMVKADRENAQANVLHVRLRDGSLALATMADIERVTAAAIHDKTQDGLEAGSEYVARCLLVTEKGLRCIGEFRYPAKFLKQASLTERVTYRMEMERQAERAAYRVLGKEASDQLVTTRLLSWAEPI